MKRIATAAIVILALGCMQKPRPISTEAEMPINPADRPAIAVEYVGVPTLSVYQQPVETAPVIGNYAYTESISVLKRQGDWSQIRMFSGVGWVKSNELINADQVKLATEKAVPRFFEAPPQIQRPRARGEIVFEAKVNTAGEVFEVRTVRNTTGIQSLAEENAKALQTAKFYPMIDKGQRKAFIYEHRVYY